MEISLEVKRSAIKDAFQHNNNIVELDTTLKKKNILALWWQAEVLHVTMLDLQHPGNERLTTKATPFYSIQPQTNIEWLDLVIMFSSYNQSELGTISGYNSY